MARVARTAIALVAFALVAAAASSAQASPPRRAILLRGADAVKGLPFFPPNALAALSGAYSLDGPASPGSAPRAQAAGAAAEVPVWYSRAPIVPAPSWKRVDLGAGLSAGEAAYSFPRGELTVLALKEGKYSLFFELPDDPRAGAFARAFARKFQAFFDNAADDAELSFPAFVDY
jgi:hypothetical protein